MGGNDTHDKHGNPYELDDSKERLYDQLQQAREELDARDNPEWIMEKASQLLKENKISVEQYIEIAEIIVGKEDFWKMHKIRMEEYFIGINLLESTPKFAQEFPKDENVGKPRIFTRGKF